MRENVILNYETMKKRVSSRYTEILGIRWRIPGESAGVDGSEYSGVYALWDGDVYDWAFAGESGRGDGEKVENRLL